MSRYLITGGAGFIGSHFVRMLSEKRDCFIVVYDKLTYAADLTRLVGVSYTLVEGDVLNANHFAETLRKYDITHIVHFAAETHVDRSLSDDMPFVQTNILGTASVLESASQVWRTSPDGFKDKRFVHISTDEVYGGSTEASEPSDEKAALSPSNPYAATKAAADQLVIAKMNGVGFPAIIIRSSNNFGGAQNPEKLIPKVLTCLASNLPIPVYGEGLQKRCWISAKTLCDIIDFLIEKGEVGQIFNIKGMETYTNLELVKKIRRAFLEKYAIADPCYAEITFVEDRKGHDFFYNIEASKVAGLLPLDFHYETMDDFLMAVL